MLTRMKLRSFVIVTAFVAMLAWDEQPALCDEQGTGIWVYDDPMSISLINLTNYPLTYLDVGPDPVISYGGTGGDQDILSYGGNWAVAPFRTMVSNYSSGGGIPRSWDGARTLMLTGCDECMFDIVFKRQKAYGLAEHGTWVGLSPYGTGQGWHEAGDFAFGRWATSLNDSKMHNVMTLIGDTCMISIYSGDNTNIVVVVQQHYAEDDDIVMDDTEAYQGAKLDFVDNGEYSVPR